MLGNNQRMFLGIRNAVASVVLAAGLGAVAPTTVVATPPGDDLEAAVGESIKTRLEAIDVIGVDLETKPKAAAASTNAVTVERAASAMFSVAERNADDLSKRRAKEGLVVLSSEIELVGHTVIETQGDNKVVSYEYLFTRELPCLTGDDAWQEVVEYEATIDTKTQSVTNILVKDLDYYTSSPRPTMIDGKPASATGPSTAVDAPPRSEASLARIETKDVSASNRQRIANYALKWWNSKNDNYPTDYANDTANTKNKPFSAMNKSGRTWFAHRV